MTGFQVPRCEGCGHVQGDHLSGGTALNASQGGQCRAPGCDCRAFVKRDEAKWLEQTAKRLDEHEAAAWKRIA